MCPCAHVCAGDCVFVCAYVCLPVNVWSNLWPRAPSGQGATPPPPSIENWRRELLARPCHPGQEDSAFLTGLKNWGREMKCRFWRGLEGYIWISWVYLERFVGFFSSSVLSWEGDEQVPPSIPSPPQKTTQKTQQDLCLELLLDVNAMKVPGERTVHVGEGF